MKNKDKSLLIQADVQDLVKQAQDLRTKLAALTVSRYTKPSKNVREALFLRKKLAVVLTYIRQKELQYGK